LFVESNLFLIYFPNSCRSLAVLDLIAKMLLFDDEQKVAVGLMVGSEGFRHTVSSMFNSFVGSTPPKRSAPQDADNLSEVALAHRCI
jgi:hypothetical protein